jgi:hypothetical protein
VRRASYRALLTAGVALVAAGCGSSSGAPPTSTHRPTTTTSVTPSTAPAPDQAFPLRFSAPHPVAPGNQLVTVSCGGTSSCVAFDNTGRAYHFDGVNWSGPTPASPQAIGPGAISVSCASPSFCVAIPSGAVQVITFNGQSWSAPVTLGGSTGLEAVGCAPSAYCAAVDGEGNAFSLSGTSWTRTSGDWGSVSAISCTSSVFCMSASGGLSQWDGESWTMPDPDGSSAPFTGVSCATTSFCVSVNGGGDALYWDGTGWSAPARIEPGPAPTTTIGVFPTSVSCPTTSFCVAVDSSGGVLEWNKGTWSRTDVDGSQMLASVSCPTASFCVAVDHSGDVIVGQP